MNIQKKFRDFHDKIKLTREDQSYSDAKKKSESIIEDIKKAFKEKRHPIIETFRQGSFATHTAIKSLDGDFDVDEALVIKEDDAPADPVQCKKIINEILVKRGFINSKIKTPCVTADYASLKLHIDYPIYKKDKYFSDYMIGLGKEHSTERYKIWSDSDTKGLIEYITNRESHTRYSSLTNEEQQQFYRLVRYIKRWRDVTYTNKDTRKHVYSIGLTIMFKESFSPEIDGNGKENDLTALYNTIDYILEKKTYFSTYDGDKYNIIVNLPVEPYQDVFVKHGKNVGTELKNKLTYLRKKLKEVINEDDLTKQCIILNNLFGDDFEIPSSVGTESRKTAPNAGVVIPSQGA